VKTFFDSSAFAKRYVEEPGSEAVDTLCIAATDLALSVVCIPEIISALNRRVREQNLSARQYKTAKENLFDEIRDAVIVNLTPDVVRTSVTVLEASAVRAMDALHIACAVHWRAELFVSADKRQIAAAKRAGLPTRLV
jgi:predicted nucleic acid-binding protein